MPAIITSSSLDPTLMQLVNLIVSAMTTQPGGNVPVSNTWTFGAVKAQQVDCNSLTVQIQAPTGQVTIGFPGSPQFNLSGFISPTVLSALMNKLPNTVQNHNTVQIGPGNSESFDSPAITQAGSGKVFVAGGVTAAVSPQATVTANLYRDGTGGALLASKSVTPGGTGGAVEVAFDMSFLDTLPDANAHHYTLQVVGAGSANVTVPVNGANFQAFEL